MPELSTLDVIILSRIRIHKVPPILPLVNIYIGSAIIGGIRLFEASMKLIASGVTKMEISDPISGNRYTRGSSALISTQGGQANQLDKIVPGVST